MKLSSKARYGLKAMIVLSERYPQLVSLAEIASESALSEPYLEQLIAVLRKSGLVVSTRGAGGGYELARASEQINVGEIIRALEDELEIVDCINGSCSKKKGCLTHAVWQKLYCAMNDALNGITLASLCKGEIQ